MRGRNEVITDGKTQITWVLGPSHDARIAPVQRVGTGIGRRADTLRAELISATVELAANASHPRLVKMRDMRTAA